MRKLATPGETLKIISRYDFGFRKKFGQNFLVDEGVIVRALQAAQVGKEDVIIEIGPGIGTLTQYLSDSAHHVISIEIDKKLIPILEETLSGCENVDVINQDVLKVDLNAIAQQYHAGLPGGSGAAGCDGSHFLHPLKIVANLPYYITTPILMNLFRSHVPAQSITVMVQKEVAARFSAKMGSRDYGSLTVFLNYFYNIKKLFDVSKNCFEPIPKVDSAVIKLTRTNKYKAKFFEQAKRSHNYDQYQKE